MNHICLILISSLLKDIPYNEDDDDAFEDSEDDLDEGSEDDLTTGKTMFIFIINIFNDQNEEDNYHQDCNRQHNHLGQQ